MINIISKQIEFEIERNGKNAKYKKKRILEIEKVTQHLNNQMDEATEEFYHTKKGKEKDDDL